MIIPKYPEDFTDYSEEKNISENEINSCINCCIDYLEDNQLKNFTSTTKGNTLIEVQRVRYFDSNYEYGIIVSKNFQESETTKCTHIPF